MPSDVAYDREPEKIELVDPGLVGPDPDQVGFLELERGANERLLLRVPAIGEVSVGGAAASSAWPLAARAQQQATKLLAAQCGGLRRRYCFTYRRRAILAVQPA
jgi:hypothetical protein